MNTVTEPDRSAFRLSLPVLFGYIPLGIAFGVLFSELGYHWLYATLMGVVIYAGAGQFLAVGLLANHAGLVEVFVATLLLNARHMVYGLSLLSTLSLRGPRRWYLIYALTDETYSLLSMLQAGCDRSRTRLQFKLALLNHLYWVIGAPWGPGWGGRSGFSTAGIEFRPAGAVHGADAGAVSGRAPTGGVYSGAGDRPAGTVDQRRQHAAFVHRHGRFTVDYGQRGAPWDRRRIF